MEGVLNGNFFEMNAVELELLEGGTIWGLVGGICQVIAGGAEAVGGAVLFLIPDPTNTTKFAGAGAVVLGIATISNGITDIASNIES